MKNADCDRWSHCAWCNRSYGQLHEITAMVPNALGFNPRPVTLCVHPEHERATRTYLTKLLRHSKHFVFGILLVTAYLFVGPPLLIDLMELRNREARLIMYGGGLAVIATILWAWPFATSTTAGGLGFRTSILMVRAAAVLVGTGTAWILVAALSG